MNLRGGFSLLGSNFLSVGVSAALVFVLPKLMGVEEYASWQLYLYWVAFAALFHLGWVDGIYVLLGKRGHINEILWPKSQFYTFAITSFGLGLAFILVGLFAFNAGLIFICVVVSIVITNCRAYCYAVMQCKGEMSVYSRNLAVSQFILLVICPCIILAPEIGIYILVGADLTSRCFTLIMAIFALDKIGEPSGVRLSKKEIFANGLPLSAAYLTSILSVAVVRAWMHFKWGLIFFGGFSLVFSVSKLFLILVQPVTISMFPHIVSIKDRRDAIRQAAEIDCVVSNLLAIGIFFYHLGGIFISEWLPQYKEYVIYYHFLSIFCFFEARCVAIYVPVLKAHRNSKWILFGNLAQIIFLVMSGYAFSVVWPDAKYLTIALCLSSALKMFVFSNVSQLLKFFKFSIRTITISVLIILAAFMDYGADYLLYSLSIYLIVFAFYFFFDKKFIVRSANALRRGAR